MRFTFAIFNKHKRKIERKDSKDFSNVLISFIICTIITLKYNTIIFATNIVDNVDNNIIKEAFFNNNLLLNETSYKYSELEEKAKTETIDYSSTQEEIAMDIVANKYDSDVLVFNSQDNYYCDVISETNSYQKLNVCGVEVINYSSNRNIDFEKILAMDDIFFEQDDEVTMYTTHTSESYANVPEYSAPARTLDGKYNMLNIASNLFILIPTLNEQGPGTFISLLSIFSKVISTKYWKGKDSNGIKIDVMMLSIALYSVGIGYYIILTLNYNIEYLGKFGWFLTILNGFTIYYTRIFIIQVINKIINIDKIIIINGVC